MFSVETKEDQNLQNVDSITSQDSYKTHRIRTINSCNHVKFQNHLTINRKKLTTYSENQITAPFLHHPMVDNLPKRHFTFRYKFYLFFRDFGLILELLEPVFVADDKTAFTGKVAWLRLRLPYAILFV